jgi:hypothetical protein
MFLLLIFTDTTQSRIVATLKRKRMKDIIDITNGAVSYNTIRQKPAMQKKYVTKKSIYSVIRL